MLSSFCKNTLIWLYECSWLLIGLFYADLVFALLYELFDLLQQGNREEGDSDEEGSLTDVGSTCSGLTDLSGVSDLEVDLEEAPEGTIDAGAEDEV